MLYNIYIYIYINKWICIYLYLSLSLYIYIYICISINKYIYIYRAFTSGWEEISECIGTVVPMGVPLLFLITWSRVVVSCRMEDCRPRGIHTYVFISLSFSLRNDARQPKSQECAQTWFRLLRAAHVYDNSCVHFSTYMLIHVQVHALTKEFGSDRIWVSPTCGKDVHR